MDGTYSDHAGVRTAGHHDTHDTVTNQHFTGSGKDRTGMDLTITKVSEAGVPDADGKMLARTYGWMQAVAGFSGTPNVVAAVGCAVGDLTVPMNDGTNKMIPNSKFVSYDYNGMVPCQIRPARAAQAADWPRLAGA